MKTELPPLKFAIPPGYCELPDTAKLRKGDLCPTTYSHTWMESGGIGRTIGDLKQDTLFPLTIIRKLPTRTDRIPKGFQKLKRKGVIQAGDLFADKLGQTRVQWFTTSRCGEALGAHHAYAYVYIRPI